MRIIELLLELMRPLTQDERYEYEAWKRGEVEL